MAILLTVAPALVVVLHGKLEPSAMRGLEFGEPYGTGVFMIMCAFMVVRATAMVAMVAFSEGILTKRRGCWCRNVVDSRPASFVLCEFVLYHR